GQGCRVGVRLESLPRGAYQGVGEGPASLEGELRAAAEATLDAIRQTGRAQNMTFSLREVATFDAFGKPGVMVSVGAEDAQRARALLGFSPLGDDPARATALAVLSATNRLLAIRPGP